VANEHLVEEELLANLTKKEAALNELKVRCHLKQINISADFFDTLNFSA
jgi:hypothetical protein